MAPFSAPRTSRQGSFCDRVAAPHAAIHFPQNSIAQEMDPTKNMTMATRTRPGRSIPLGPGMFIPPKFLSFPDHPA